MVKPHRAASMLSAGKSPNSPEGNPTPPDSGTS